MLKTYCVLFWQTSTAHTKETLSYVLDLLVNILIGQSEIDITVKTQNIDVAGLKRDRDMIWAAAYAEYMRTKHWWLKDHFVEYTHHQTELRREADLWSQLVQEHLAHKDEVTIKEAFDLCFPQDSIETRLDPKKINQQDQRRMANCLLAAGFERNGKFSSGKQRNQVRFTRASE